MKILAITNMYPRPDRPGWGSFIKSQIDSLKRKGVDVDLLVIDGYKSKFHYIFAIVRLWIYCFRNHYDLVHAHYGLSGLVARFQWRFPVVVSFCGDDLLGHSDQAGNPTLTSLFWVKLHKILACCVGRSIVKSQAMAQLLRGSACAVVPNGVDLNVFRPLDAAKCKKELGLDLDQQYVLFPYAKDNVRKNYILFEKAIRLLQEKYDIVLLPLVVDDVPNETIPVYLNAVELVVLVSFWEGSPNVIKEAMACNTRIVSVDVGDVREILAGVEGCLLCGYEPEDVACKIKDILATARKTRGREAIAHLSLESIADRVLEEYKKVIGTGAATR